MPDKNIPSIFNDVIGPVMRGPSSSHCAAALRIGRLARDLMDGAITEVNIEFDTKGSLATTHESQGSDMGLCGGLMGWEMTDDRLPHSSKTIQQMGIRSEIRIVERHDAHPNTYHLTLLNQNERHSLTAISTGGGMIEIVQVDGIPVSICGDYFETLIYADSQLDEIMAYVQDLGDVDFAGVRTSENNRFIEIKSQSFLESEILNKIRTKYSVRSIKMLAPVLPVLSRKDLSVPFTNCSEMIRHNECGNKSLWELAVEYESSRGNLDDHDVKGKMKEIILVLENSIREGLTGTHYKDRILGQQSHKFALKAEQGTLLDAGMLNRMTLYVTALMEVKSSMGVIVAAPTAGACAALPGACLAAADALDLSLDQKIQAMLAAGMVGVFIAAGSTFAAEVGGCQAETGAAAGMAAAALVTLRGGSAEQAVSAASMALQNSLGIICDPVANRVEVPCLGKNVMGAANALTCANMVLAGFDAVIPLDEVIETMNRVGKQLPKELCCTALGGLSITPTSKKIEQMLHIRKSNDND